MNIDPFFFKAELSKAYTKLIESKRGLASELARSIGKDPSFINNVKREKPVNSLHLKAVELILGPEKVLELLSLNVNIDTSLKKKGWSKTKYQYPINKFKNPEEGLKNNEHLITIEDASPKLYKKVSEYLETNRIAVETIEEEKKEKYNYPKKTKKKEKI